MIFMVRLLRKVLFVRECVYNDYNLVIKNYYELMDMFLYVLLMKEIVLVVMSFVYVFVLK